MANKLEAEISNAISLVTGSREDVRIYRNNVGALQDRNGRLVKYGLFPGSGDRIGLVAPFGRFLSIEVKPPGYKPPNARERERFESQKNWARIIRRFGGVAGIVDNPEDAVALVELARCEVVNVEQLARIGIKVNE